MYIIPGDALDAKLKKILLELLFVLLPFLFPAFFQKKVHLFLDREDQNNRVQMVAAFETRQGSTEMLFIYDIYPGIVWRTAGFNEFSWS